MKNLYCIIGPSGSGKTTVADDLSRYHGLISVQSYTTRPPRYSDESGHIFVTDKEFDALGELCAFVEYNSYRYGVTPDILEKSDLYVIDPAGARYLYEHYKGDKTIYNIWLETPPYICAKRMLRRGDSYFDVLRRIKFDHKAFSKEERNKTMSLTPGIIFQTALYSREEMAKRLWNFIQYTENL